jgi:hypothetical protein
VHGRNTSGCVTGCLAVIIYIGHRHSQICLMRMYWLCVAVCSCCVRVAGVAVSKTKASDSGQHHVLLCFHLQGAPISYMCEALSLVCQAQGVHVFMHMLTVGVVVAV